MRSIEDQINLHLTMLGSTPTSVANSLFKSGIKGVRENACECPVANYLKRQYPNYKWSVGEDYARGYLAKKVFQQHMIDQEGHCRCGVQHTSQIVFPVCECQRTDCNRIHYARNVVYVRLPDQVSMMIRLFDAGDFTGLLKRRWIYKPKAKGVNG